MNIRNRFHFLLAAVLVLGAAGCSKSPEEVKAAQAKVEAETTGHLLVKSNLASATLKVVSADGSAREGTAGQLIAGTLGQPGDFSVPGIFRISLAGAQEKTALLWHKGAWHVPRGATPTTHILKLPIGRAQAGLNLSSSVENEWLCTQLLAGYGLPVAPCRPERPLANTRFWWWSASTANRPKAANGGCACRRRISARPPALPPP